MKLELPVRYQALGILGQGGFGLVVRARDRVLDREVAIKLLRLAPSPAVLERFDREAKILAGLEHPHILRVFDSGLAGGLPYLVTELLDGRDLTSLSLPDPLPAMLDVAQGLQAVHDAGLVHRDVKPANIRVTAQGRAVLLDLGLATGDDLQVLTATGMVVGTPAYMAPEILDGRPASPASDWYAWGRSLDLILPEPRPPGVVRLVAACMDPDPAARPQHARALQRLLEASPPGRSMGSTGGFKPASTESAPPPRRRRRQGAMGATVLALLALAAWWARPAPSVPVLDPVPGALPVEAPGVLGADLGAQLRAELDAAFYLTIEVPSFTGGPTALPFTEALAVRGVGALDALPRHMQVLTWLVDGGEAAALTQGERAALAEHDRALMDLGLSPSFGPLLAASAWRPDEPAPALAEAMDAARRSLDEVLGKLPAASQGGVTVFMEDPERPGQAALLRLRASPAGRGSLQDLLSAGCEAARTYLLACRRQLDLDPGPVPAARVREFRGAFENVSVLLLGSMLTASRDRLFGARPRSAAAAAFEAEVLKHLRVLRGRAAVAEGPLGPEELEGWRRGVAAAAEAGDPELLRGQAAGLLLRLDDLGEVEELTQVHRRYRVALAGARGRTRDKIEELVTRRGLAEPR